MFKIGLTSFISLGDAIVTELSERKPVFLDLKLHDIPAQVDGAIRSVRATGASFTTVHASGGDAMLRAAVDAGEDEVIVLAVTVLTSLADEDVHAMGWSKSAADSVLRLASLALNAGVPGLVCSPQEVAPIRAEFGPRDDGGPVLVVPGIRPQGSDAGDQKRVLGPASAIEAGADVLVIGRPITAASDPAAAAASIHEEVGEG